MSKRMTAGDWASLLIDQRYSLHRAIVDAIEAHAAAEVAAAVEQEREECAKLVEEFDARKAASYGDWHYDSEQDIDVALANAAAAIRKRGGKP